MEQYLFPSCATASVVSAVFTFFDFVYRNEHKSKFMKNFPRIWDDNTRNCIEDYIS